MTRTNRETTRTGAGAETGGGVRPWAVIGGLVVADVAFAYQQTSIVPAVHTVEQSLGASPEWSAWLVTVYLIVATIATPAMGRLADLHGRRRMLLTGLSVFLIGSIGAALAPNLAVLLVCRAVQGVGGAVYPLSLALARRLLPPDLASTALALSAGAFGLGTVVGFASGGLLAQYLSWHWIFVVGAVLVAVGLGTVLILVPAADDRAGGGYDWRGTVALSVFAIGLLVALTLVVPLGWGSPVTAGLLALAALAAVAWGRLELKERDPLIDVHALLAGPVLRANLATIGLGWALFSSYLLIPQFALARPAAAHYGLGATTVAVGLIMVPLAAGQTVAGPLAGLISRRTGPRLVYAAGLLLVAAATGWLSVIHGGLPAFITALVLLGLGVGAALQSSSSVATQGVSEDVAAASSSLNSTIRRFAGGIGGQVATILLASWPVINTGHPRFPAFTLAFLVAAGLCLAGCVLIAASGRVSRSGPGR
jgi:MFS family permease